jgi:hypothetical protein
MKEIQESTAQAMVRMGTTYKVAPDLLPFESHYVDGVIVHAVLVDGTLLVSDALHRKLVPTPGGGLK